MYPLKSSLSFYRGKVMQQLGSDENLRFYFCFLNDFDNAQLFFDWLYVVVLEF